ncbi:hypothetical protein ACSBR2_040033 [Camellia fascicularis]
MFVTVRKKELDLIGAQMSVALANCVDLARFVLEVISEMFPVDKRLEKSERVNDLGWACVMILESLILVVIDLILRNSRTSSGSKFVVVMSAKLIWKLICVLFDIVSQIHFKRFVGSPRNRRPEKFPKFLWRCFAMLDLSPSFQAIATRHRNSNLLQLKMATHFFFITIATIALVSILASASDASPLQDFCVAVNDSKSAGILYAHLNLLIFTSQIPFRAVFVNGKFCNDPKLAKADDFFFSGLLTPQNTSNPVVTPVNVMQIPGLNTLGISLARIEFAPYGLNPPHTHPRGTEILVVLEGTLYVGFVTSNPENCLFTKVLYLGDVFVFPKGLIHFQFNEGKTNAVAISGLSSQNPGVITIANAVFGSNPKIYDGVLAKAFQVDKKVVDYLQAQFWWPNN